MQLLCYLAGAGAVQRRDVCKGDCGWHACWLATPRLAPPPSQAMPLSAPLRSFSAHARAGSGWLPPPQPFLTTHTPAPNTAHANVHGRSHGCPAGQMTLPGQNQHGFTTSAKTPPVGAIRATPLRRPATMVARPPARGVQQAAAHSTHVEAAVKRAARACIEKRGQWRPAGQARG